MSTSDTTLIIGASLAGIRCATSLRRAGFEGVITLIGDETHPPYDRPPLSKKFLAGEWNSDRIQLTPEDKWDELDLDFRPGLKATGLEEQTRTVTFHDGSTLTADSIVIATGARPRLLPGVDPSVKLHVLRTVDDASDLRDSLTGEAKRVTVIGAGFIGAEVAATAQQLGHNVTLIEAGAVPMERGLGSTIGTICGELHVDEGVDLRLATGVQTIRPNGNSALVDLSDGSSVEADVVVVGIGVIPNTEWLVDSGLTLNDGIETNSFCEAADGIYAAGDVARFPNEAFDNEMMRIEHWENAVEQGSYVGRRIAGTETEPFAPVPWFWSDQYSYKIQLAGRPQGGDDMEIITGSAEEKRFAAIFGRNGRLTGVFGLNRPRHVMQYRRQIADGATWQEALAFAAAARQA